MAVTKWEPATQRAVEALQKRGLTVYASNNQPPRGKMIAVYGRSGYGKTSEIAKIADKPELAPVWMANAEGGAWVLSHRDDIVVVDINNWLDYEKFVAAVVGPSQSPCKTVVIDLATELQAKSVMAQVRPGERVEQQHWLKSHVDILNTTRVWRNWSQKTGCNVVLMLAQDTGPKVKDGPIYEEIGFTKGLKEDWPHIMDIIGQITYAGNKKRMLDFSTSDLRSTKFRRSQSDVAMKIPLRFTYTEQDSPIADILLVLNEGREWPTTYKQAAPPPDTVTAPVNASPSVPTNPVEARVEAMQAEAETQAAT